MEITNVPFKLVNSETASEYRFQNYVDSMYIILSTGFSGDMGEVDAVPYYEFRKDIKDGLYEIFIDSVSVQKATFKNGMRNGLSMNTFGFALETYQIFNYLNDDIIEVFECDNSGNILMYYQQFDKHKYYVFYHFNNTGNLIGLSYAFSFGSTIPRDEFMNGILDSTYCNHCYNSKFERDGIHIKDELNGQMSLRYFTEQYSLSFKNGELLNWEYVNSKSNTNQKSSQPSNEILKKKELLLSYIKFN
mgnify:CR=1 FL=1